ncbi:retinoic acid-induced protein 2 [Lates japonicus]|uniref:Retinoic acid-induced protein 2 n=1 Tax=Lates japonicus TaxID=270547 RepID=A0AAD3N560_LATJO|nr:retinoic acid-induced protein 2 [Lates japonicus]
MEGSDDSLSHSRNRETDMCSVEVGGEITVQSGGWSYPPTPDDSWDGKGGLSNPGASCVVSGDSRLNLREACQSGHHCCTRVSGREPTDAAHLPSRWPEQPGSSAWPNGAALH